MKAVDLLAERWLSEAEILEGALDERGAALYRSHATELQEAIRYGQDELLTLAEAVKVSGYSDSGLRRLIASGDLPQAGVKGRPRLRRGDLPSRPKTPDDAPTIRIDRHVAAALGKS